MSWSGVEAVLSVFVPLCRPPCSVPGQGSGKTSLPDGQDLPFLSRVSIWPCRRPSQPRTVERPGYPVRASRSTGLYTGLCVIFILYWVLCLSHFFSVKHSPPSRGCRCCHLPSWAFAVSSSYPPARGRFWHH